MSREMPPEKRAAALNDRLYAAFNDGLELIAIQAGYRFGWYSGLAKHGPCTANQLSAFTGTGPRFTREWLPQQTAAGLLDADISGIEPTFRLSPEIAAALLGEGGTGENTLAAMLSEVFVDWMRLAKRLVEAWRHDRSGFTDADIRSIAHPDRHVRAAGTECQCLRRFPVRRLFSGRLACVREGLARAIRARNGRW